MTVFLIFCTEKPLSISATPCRSFVVIQNRLGRNIGITSLEICPQISLVIEQKLFATRNWTQSNNNNIWKSATPKPIEPAVCMLRGVINKSRFISTFKAIDEKGGICAFFVEMRESQICVYISSRLIYLVSQN
jgi:hypothetical protein